MYALMTLNSSIPTRCFYCFTIKPTALIAFTGKCCVLKKQFQPSFTSRIHVIVIFSIGEKDRQAIRYNSMPPQFGFLKKTVKHNFVFIFYLCAEL